jgi:hypothetical protein
LNILIANWDNPDNELQDRDE